MEKKRIPIHSKLHISLHMEKKRIPIHSKLHISLHMEKIKSKQRHKECRFFDSLFFSILEIQLNERRKEGAEGGGGDYSRYIDEIV